MPDLVGALFAAAIAALVLGVVEGQGWGWISPRIIAAFVAAVGLGVPFVRRCQWRQSRVELWMDQTHRGHVRRC